VEMNWESPIKAARLCFYETGNIGEHIMSTDDHGAIDRRLAFLLESKAIIVGLEHFAEEGIVRLRNAQDRGEHSLFASPDCYGRWDAGLRQRCLRACPLKSGA
jgi:hypothetical protein